jgi:hypothetical protein
LPAQVGVHFPHAVYAGAKQPSPPVQARSQLPPQPSGPPHLPVQLGAHVPHTVLTGGKQVVPPAHVDAQLPPQPSGPPHLPAQVGLHAPSAWTCAAFGEHA